MSRVLLINASSRRQGATTALAARLLEGTCYETVHLIDHVIHPKGNLPAR